MEIKQNKVQLIHNLEKIIEIKQKHLDLSEMYIENVAVVLFQLEQQPTEITVNVKNQIVFIIPSGRKRVRITFRDDMFTAFYILGQSNQAKPQWEPLDVIKVNNSLNKLSWR